MTCQEHPFLSTKCAVLQEEVDRLRAEIRHLTSIILQNEDTSRLLLESASAVPKEM